MACPAKTSAQKYNNALVFLSGFNRDNEAIIARISQAWRGRLMTEHILHSLHSKDNFFFFD